jgi:hypothetical protein
VLIPPHRAQHRENRQIHEIDRGGSFEGARPAAIYFCVSVPQNRKERSMAETCLSQNYQWIKGVRVDDVRSVFAVVGWIEIENKFFSWWFCIFIARSLGRLFN